MADDTRTTQPAAADVTPVMPARCAGCGQLLDDGEPTLAMMQRGRVIAAYHERCHPHHRRSGCSRC